MKPKKPEKKLECPECGQICNLGKYNNHESYSMLSYYG